MFSIYSNLLTEHNLEWSNVWVQHSNWMLTMTAISDIPEIDEQWYHDMMVRNLIYDC
jgi:hypothetical protein